MINAYLEKLKHDGPEKGECGFQNTFQNSCGHRGKAREVPNEY
jgi:hypothetical protein